MKHQTTRTWSEWWLRHLSWRDLNKMRQLSQNITPTSSLEKRRRERVEMEWRRRKREGSGGLAAADD